MPNKTKKLAWEVEAFPQNVELSDPEEDFELKDVMKTHVEELAVVTEELAVVTEEPAVVAKRGKLKLNDPGVESRKK